MTSEQNERNDKTIMDRFERIETDRWMWNPNKGCTMPLVGFLVNMIPMPPMQMGKELREWECFLIRTTEPTLGIDREESLKDNPQAKEVPVGSEVLVPATFQLTQHLEKAAASPKYCFEVFIEPKRKMNIGRGQTMWLYNLGANMKNPRLRREFGTSAMLGAPTEDGTKALPARGQATAEQATDDIPF
jgi:hypothetical protein